MSNPPSNLVFQQKTPTGRKHIVLEETVIKVRSKRGFTMWDYEASYEHLGFDLTYKTIDTNKKALIGCGLGFFAMIAFAIVKNPVHTTQEFVVAASFICIAIGVIILGFYIKPDRYVYISGGSKQIELYLDKPNEKVVSDFIDEVHNRIRVYWKNKYLKTFDTLVADEHRRYLNYMEKYKAITTEEKEAFWARIFYQEMRNNTSYN